MRWRIAVLLLASVLFGVFAGPARAGSGVQIQGPAIQHQFGEWIKVQARVQSEQPIRELKVVIQVEDGAILETASVPLTPEGEVSYTLDLRENPIQTFVYLLVWFEVELQDGSRFASQAVEYFYDDNRFDWQSVKTEEFSVHWYHADEDVGRKILATAYEGWQNIHSLIDVPRPVGVEIYAYVNAEEMQDTLLFTGRALSWVAGHANPDLDLIVVSIPTTPEQELEITRQIPHELMHVLLYNKLGAGYDNLPRWLNEGLATTAELLPNADYPLLLDKAYEREALIPIVNLCVTFPVDIANFQLAYAEADAFTRYLQRTYGSEKIEALLQAYASGQGCTQAVENTFGVPLPEIEKDWRREQFRENAFQEALISFAPWLVLTGAAFVIPLGLIFSRWIKRWNTKKPARWF